MRHALLALFAAVLSCGATFSGGGVSTPSAASPITADLQATRTSCLSPCGIVFDASATTHTTVIDPFVRLDYEIDYGNDTGTWTIGTGNTDKGKDFSPLGAHVYECSNGSGSGCAFTATLTVRDPSGNTATDTVAITVYDPNITGANGYGDAGETVCISETTDHTGCPAGATQVSTSGEDWVGLLDTHIDTNGAKRVLFHRGQTWTKTGDGGWSAGSATNVIVGPYGTGADPKLECPDCVAVDGAEPMFFEAKSGFTAHDLDFGAAANRETTLWGGSNGTTPDNVTFHRIDLDDGEFQNVSLVPDGTAGVSDWATFSTGIVFSEIVATSLQEPSAVNSTFVFGPLYKSAIIGSTFNRNTLDGNAIRYITGNTLFHAHNYIDNVQYVATLRSQENDTSNPAGVGLRPGNVVFVDNDFRTGKPSTTGWILDVGDGLDGFGSHWTNGVIRRNWQRIATDMSATDCCVYAFLLVAGGGGGSIVENWDVSQNLMQLSTDANWTSGEAFVKNDGAEIDLRVYNNSKYGGAGSDTFGVDNGDASVVYNNIIFAPTPTVVAATEFNATSVADNLCGDASGGNQCAANLATSPYSTSPPTAPTHFQSSASAVVDQATALDGLYREFDGSLITGTPDIGAWNQ